MPDAFNRMQAGTKATTLGSILFLLGIGIMKPGLAGEDGHPHRVHRPDESRSSSNALARAAHAHRKRIGAPAWNRTPSPAADQGKEAGHGWLTPPSWFPASS
ncbi:MAG: monovalent cation/H(+) antiporter subunit G [Chromatiales bacterium]|nr:monovalent cation/H(+) antiporter subunit G [Chromatiales bacterium]